MLSMKSNTTNGQKGGSVSRLRELLTILAFLVTEVLGDGQTSESDTSAGPRWLVHLTEHQRDLGLAIELNDFGFLHFVVQVVALTGTLADTSENRETTVGLGDVVLESVSINTLMR
jgi:hypothetical protein